MQGMLAIDFEASCLPRHGRSFPIEVGVSDGQLVHSWLIRPDAQWEGWDWTAEAENLHGLSRARLWSEGLSPRRVMTELTLVVGDRPLVADSDLDQYWLDTLMAAAGREDRLKISHAGLLIDQWQPSLSAVDQAKAEADRIQPQRHRAGADAHWLALTLRALAPRQERRAPEPFREMAAYRDFVQAA
jgi:hypothetical protein